MPVSPPIDRSHESVINDAVARLFRDQFGLVAASETLRGGPRPDVLVRTQEGPVIVEVELEPGRTVEADALSRLGMEIDGRKVQVVFAVIVPELIRTVPQEHLLPRLATTNVRWQEWRSDGTSGPRMAGTPAALARSVEQATPPTGDLEEAVDALDEGARRAGARLYGAPGTVARVARVFGIPPGDEAANMAALVTINAMVFQERLASIHPDISPLEMTRDHGHISKTAVIRAWDTILDIDYWPIFSMAREVAGTFSEVEASDVLDECARAAMKLLELGTVGRHDLAGRIFNRLVAERKFLASFYTTIPTATLLAGLALLPDRWPTLDWSDVKALSEFQVLDPACGTGTLLMAAYRQIVENYRYSSNVSADVEELHKALMENIIYGADVVQAAIHLTAATLAAMSPAITFNQMNLHTLKLGLENDGAVYLGSLDWLVAPEVQSLFSTTSEQVGATSGISGALVQRPNADLVISNPPYTRRGSDSGHEEAIAQIFALPEGDTESQSRIARRTTELLRGTAANQMAGHGSSFAVLADRLVKPGGRIALVLPVTAIAGEAWSEVREMLASRYQVEFVLSSHDPEMRSMSYDTDIAEILLVARRLEQGEVAPKRGVFCNLWRAPRLVTDALAILNAVSTMAQGAIHRSDGPPVGGVPIIIGGVQWGELLDAPVGNRPWTGARWKRALVTQFASALQRGELWSMDGTQVLAQIRMARLGDMVSVGPQHRQIRGVLGVFDAYRGWHSLDQFLAIWRHQASVHKTLRAEPNAHLVPQPGRNYAPVWAQSGTLHYTQDIRYDSQRVAAVRTQERVLGIRAWYTMTVSASDEADVVRREIACALWANSTLGLLLHADHANQAMQGRGTGSKAMLEELPFLDVRVLDVWQLEAAEAIWRDLAGQEFESFHRCAVDPVRVELDRRVLRDMLGLDSSGEDTVKRLRLLLASEPSIHGSKQPELPQGDN